MKIKHDCLHQNELPFKTVFKYIGSTMKTTFFFFRSTKKLVKVSIKICSKQNWSISERPDNMEHTVKTMDDLNVNERFFLKISRGEVNSRFTAWNFLDH